MQDLHTRHLEIRHGLNLAGTSFSEIARMLKVSHTTVNNVSRSKTRSARIEQAIASALGKKPCEIWPEYFEGKGKPL